MRLQDDRWLLLMAAGLLVAGLGGLAWMLARPLGGEIYEEIGQVSLVLGGAMAVLPAPRLGAELDGTIPGDRYETRGNAALLGVGVGLILVVMAFLMAQGLSTGTFLLLAAGWLAAAVGGLALVWCLDGVAEVSGLSRARGMVWAAVPVALVGGALFGFDVGSEDRAAVLLLGLPSLVLAVALLDAWWNGFD